ncbi:MULTISPECIES: hypothetical protein [unclassified Endozoicomonas]|uniref:hypothetical protein n=1 Tax=unclassified Endozoicomonas TaxID=2644528 RepID=UPI003BB659F5
MLDLENPPSDAKYLKHHFADFIELLALSQDEEGISKDEASERIFDDGDNQNEETTNDFLTDCYELIAYRSDIYGENYPFLLDDNETLKLREDQTNLNRAYIFLLLCSCTSKLDRSVASDLRRDFEHLCNSAIKYYLPIFSDCHIFGKSGLETDRYSGHISQKLRLLARDLGTNTTFDVDDFAASDTGDKGLDIVAWSHIPGDTYKNYNQIYFAQCATGRDWKNKQHEPDKINNHLSLNNNYTIMICIPYDSRKTNGKPSDHTDITVPIFIDRYRLLSLLGNGVSITELDSNATHIQRVIDYTEELI